MTPGGSHRAFGALVWAGRLVGWALLVVGVFGILHVHFFAERVTSFRMLPSLALVIVAVIWILGLELFLRFFDRYLSRN